MAEIKPFRAVRPSAEKVGKVSSRPYGSYSVNEKLAILGQNPYSFLHILNPGYKYQTEPKGMEWYQQVKKRYNEFLDEGILVHDQAPFYYLYEITYGDHSSLGIFCAVSIEDYRNNRIKKHEDTIVKRERIFADYLKNVGFNAEPVLLTYQDDQGIANLFDEVIKNNPLFDFETKNGSRHKIWQIVDGNAQQKLTDKFAGIDALYIADGHHRSASSDLLAKELAEEGHEKYGLLGNHQYFMGYLIAEDQLRLGSFTRMVRDLNQLTTQDFLNALSHHFSIEDHGTSAFEPSEKHQFGLYIERNYYGLGLKTNSYAFTNSLSKLDAHIVYETILKPILGIEDLRYDKRIKYYHFENSAKGMKNMVDQGKFALGISMLPVSIEEVKKIADDNLVMPPKSTYFEPKLRSGLTIFEI